MITMRMLLIVLLVLGSAAPAAAQMSEGRAFALRVIPLEAPADRTTRWSYEPALSSWELYELRALLRESREARARSARQAPRRAPTRGPGWESQIPLMTTPTRRLEPLNCVVFNTRRPAFPGTSEAPPVCRYGFGRK